MSQMPPTIAEQSDQELCAAAGRGDFSAGAEIVRRYRDKVFRLARGMVANPAEAEEVVQDAFLRVLQHLPSFRGESSLGSWIYRIAANSALMHLRRQRRKPFLSVEEALPGLGDVGHASVEPPGNWARRPDELLLDRELGAQVESAIAALPEKYRLVLLLRDVEGLSNEEVAQTLGITVPTVKARLHRSRLFVRGRLDGYLGRRARR